MNEKIKQFAQEAGFKVNWQHEDVQFIKLTRFEKFAELIAEHCANICMEMAAKCAGLEGDGALAKDCAYWIKEDFGVKMTKLRDNRVEIPLDFSDEELLVLFKQAHECDMTFNAFVEKALVDYLEEIKNDNLLNKLDGTSVDAMVPRPWPYPEAN